MRDEEVGVGCAAIGSWRGVSCNACGEGASPASGLSRHVPQPPVVRVTCVASPASGLYLNQGTDGSQSLVVHVTDVV